ncbi:hypothetical protein QBC35DRAFT_42033 [Podospora australis]|uniref:Uncharacterized protein n=1 Tax=Podospora australis TaxID=1536484 RepID=A0AAN6WQS4_9PEZI|nr:hypothetical protein QBC35DRAFT_42033 [Podospora australis]
MMPSATTASGSQRESSFFGAFINPRPPPPLPGHEDPQARVERLRAHLFMAVLFEISCLITWVPTATFLLQQLIHGSNAPFSFNFFTAATALSSTQGAWNLFIMVCVNRKALASSGRESARREVVVLPTEPARPPRICTDKPITMGISSWWRRYQDANETVRVHSWDFLDVGLSLALARSGGSRGGD